MQLTDLVVDPFEEFDDEPEPESDSHKAGRRAVQEAFELQRAIDSGDSERVAALTKPRQRSFGVTDLVVDPFEGFGDEPEPESDSYKAGRRAVQEAFELQKAIESGDSERIAALTRTRTRRFGSF